MKLAKLFLLLATMSLISAVPLASDPAAWKGLTPVQVAQIKAGKIVLMDGDPNDTGSSARFIQAAMIFDQPIEKTYQLFKKTENQARYLPDLDSARVIKRDAKGEWQAKEVGTIGGRL